MAKKIKTELEKQYDSYKSLARYYAKKNHSGGVRYKTLEEYAEAREFFSNKEQALGALKSQKQRDFFGDALTDILSEIDVDIEDKDKREENQKDADTINKLLNKERWSNQDYDKFYELIKKKGIDLKKHYVE